MTIASRSLALAGCAALLVGILRAGVTIGASATSDSAHPATTLAAAGQQAGAAALPGSDPTADAVDAALAAFDLAGPADTTGVTAPGATTQPATVVAQRIRRFARWKQLVHATVTVDRPGTGIRTFELDHGTITALPAGSITISEAGGASVTVTTNPSTRVRKDRAKAALSDLSSGDLVVVVSTVGNAGPPRALLVVVPPAAPASLTP
jgi:Domain of unknown function (DUF5666)